MKKALKYIRKCDHFGAQIKLNLYHKETFKSLLGGSITILMVIAIVFGFVQGTISLYQQKNYTISTSKQLSIDPPLSQLNQQNFMIAFSIMFQNQVAKQFYKIFLTQESQILDQNGKVQAKKSEQIVFEKCSTSHFKNFDINNSYNLLLESQLSNYFCIPINYQLLQQGTSHSKEFQFGKIQIKSCLDESGCISKQEFDSLGINNNILQINTLVLNSLVDLNEQENVIKYFNSDFSFQTQISQQTTTDIYLEKMNVNIDYSTISIFQQIEEQVSFSIQDSKLDYQIIESIDQNLISQFQIKLSQSENKYKKSYYKIDELVSYIGGLTKFAFLIFGYVLNKYNKTGLQVALANDLYQFDIPEVKKGEVIFSFQKLVSQIVNSISQIEDIVKKFKVGAIKILKLGRISKAIISTQQSQNQQFHPSSDCLITNQSVTKRNALLIDEQIQQTDQIETLKINEKEKINSSNLDFYKNNFLEQVINVILTGNKKLQFNTIVLVKYLTCWRFSKIGQHKKRIFKQSKIMIQKDMDILVIIQKLQEMEKLKHLLLNKEQLKVFNCLPKPIVGSSKFMANDTILGQTTQLEKSSFTLTFKNRKLFESRHQYNTSKKLRKLYSAYENIKLQNEGKTEFEKIVNQKLIDCLEPPTLQHSFNSLAELQRLTNLQKERLQNTENLRKTSILLQQPQEMTFSKIKNHIKQYYFKPSNPQIQSKSNIIDEIITE